MKEIDDALKAVEIAVGKITNHDLVRPSLYNREAAGHIAYLKKAVSIMIKLRNLQDGMKHVEAGKKRKVF